MAGLSQKDQKRVIDHVQAQGVGVTDTKKGYLMRFPDGGTAMLHKTQSDRMAPMALRAQLRRHGISWPFDGAIAELPKYITEGDMRDSSLDAYRRHLGDPLPDEAFPAVLTRQVYEFRNPGKTMPKNHAPTQTYRALYRLGYVPGGRYGEKHEGKAWVRRPEETPDVTTGERKPFAPPQMFAPEPEPAAVAELKSEVTTLEVNPSASVQSVTGPQSGGREFIDSVESWTLDVDTIADIPVETMARMMRAAGLEVEIRVWKSA